MRKPTDAPPASITPAARRREQVRERTRRRLLTVAIRLFAQRGFHGVSVDDVASAARLSKRLPYYYFGSKEGLYRAVITDVYRQIEGMEFRAVDEAPTPSAKLGALVVGYFGILQQHPEFTQLLLWGNLEKGRFFPKGLLSKMPLLQRLQAIVDEGVATGEFRADLNVPHLLIHVIGLTFIYFSNQFSLSQVLATDLTTREQQDIALRQVQDVLWRGVRA